MYAPQQNGARASRQGLLRRLPHRAVSARDVTPRAGLTYICEVNIHYCMLYIGVSVCSCAICCRICLVITLRNVIILGYVIISLCRRKNKQNRCLLLGIGSVTHSYYLLAVVTITTTGKPHALCDVIGGQQMDC